MERFSPRDVDKANAYRVERLDKGHHRMYKRYPAPGGDHRGGILDVTHIPRGIEREARHLAARADEVDDLWRDATVEHDDVLAGELVDVREGPLCKGVGLIHRQLHATPSHPAGEWLRDG